MINTITLQLTNNEIYSLAENILKNPIGDCTYIPVLYNFYIQKNIVKILSLRDEIDLCRKQIISHYGEQDGEQGIRLKPEHIVAANKELKTLSNITQEVRLYQIPLSAFIDLNLTTGELKGLLPMIVEDIDENDVDITVKAVANN